ncbi:MAG TPA: S8 family serine peptidase [Steroidobacteraceae bacterium]|nr:S8 family serine peptidase [Steroidobacteraceae bacterium]
MRLAICITAAAMALSACGGSSGGTIGATGAPPAMNGLVITSEADTILHMDQLRAAGFRGGGVRVGVISTGVVNLASYQAAGVLPAGIYVSQNTAGALDEGSWMLELVHQHAPDAVLGFCDGVDLDFNGCIQDLGSNFHADIIVDDILFSGQFYPDVTAATVAQLETANDRMVFIHLSGNEQNGGYWQGPFVPVAAIIAGSQVMLLDFGIASGGASDAFNAITVRPTDRLRLIMNWNDPPHEPANHALTAYLLDGNSQVLTQVSSQSDPTLVLDYSNTTSTAQAVRLALSLDSGSAQGLVVQVTEGSATCNIECQPLSHANSGLAGGTIGDIADALVVGATFAQSPRVLEAWSNHGPFRIDFQAAGDAASPDGFDYARLATPLQIAKPDLVAPDCVTTPFSNGKTLTNNQFCGTSAAVPSIAGAAALLESAGFNRAQVLKALRSTAVPLGPAAWDPGYGFGLADAAAALHSGGN